MKRNYSTQRHAATPLDRDHFYRKRCRSGFPNPVYDKFMKFIDLSCLIIFLGICGGLLLLITGEILNIAAIEEWTYCNL